MDEVRLTASPPVSQLARRAAKPASPDAVSVEKSVDNGNGKEPTPDQGQVQESVQDRRSQVEAAVKRLNDYVQSTQRGLHFNFDESLSQTVITVVVRSTNEVIRQIPDEVALELARSLGEDSSMSLLNVKA